MVKTSSKINKKYIFENPFIKVTRACYSNNVIMNPHFHEHSAISIVLSGSMRETVDSNTGIGGTSNIIIKPAKTFHNNLFSYDCTIISMYLKEENKNKIIGHDILKKWNWIHSGDYVQFLSLLIKCQTEQQYYNKLNHFLKHLSTQNLNTKKSIPPDWIVDVKKFLDENFEDVIRSKNLAIIFKVHPVYLSRVFKKYFGLSIKSYLKTVRINSSMSAIINEDDILAQIALNNGFSDQSHFNRNFRPMTGFTPTEFKKFVQ